MPETAPVVASLDMTIPGKDTPAAPETVEVKVGEATLKVSKDAAEAITALQKSVTDHAAAATALKSQLDAATAAGPAKPAPVAATEEEQYNRLFTHPKEFLTEFEKKIKDDLIAGYTQTTLQRDFWADFYTKHADLKKHDFYVKAVLDRDMGTLGKLKTLEAIEKLGTTVKTELLALGGKPGTGLTKPAAEGGTEPLKPGSKPESESSPTDKTPPDTLTGLIRARREARRAGGGKPQATA